MINEIETLVIAPVNQRYHTVGDYWYSGTPMESVERPGPYEKLSVRISSMKNEDYEFLVLIHELIEAHLTRKRGIPEPVIKEFDEEFEKNRLPGNTDEPGDSPLAPYRREHQFATLVEKFLAKELEVDWDEYSKTVEAL